MASFTISQLQLFAKLSKIFAETFQDIHKICLQEFQQLENSQVPNSMPMNKQLHIQKHQSREQPEQSKLRMKTGEEGENRSFGDEDSDKPPKISKIKAKPHEGNEGNGEKKAEKKKKVAKWEQEGKPRPPLNAFMLFLRDWKLQIMQQNPELTPSQVSTYASALWSQLTQKQKDRYRNEYKQNRIKYDEELKQYNEKERLLNGGKPAIKMAKKLEKEKEREREREREKEKGDKLVKDILDEDINFSYNSSDSASGI